MELADTDEIGPKVRRWRQLRRLSLSQLGARVGVTASFLSQFERGECNASLATLRAITNALGVSIGELIGEGESGQGRVLRKSERPVIMSGAARKYLVSLPPLESVEIFSGEFDPGASSGPDAYSHGDSQEFLFVVKGEVVVEVDGEPHRLSGGDTIEYRSSQMHRTENAGTEVAEVLWIVSPVTVSSDEITPEGDVG